MSGSRIVYTARSSSGRKIRFRKKNRLVLLGAVLIAAVVFSAVWILRHPYQQVREFQISGVEGERRQAILEIASASVSGDFFFLIPRRSLALVRPEAVAENIRERFPELSEVEVEKKFPDKISIRAKERVFFGIYCNDLAEAGECAYLDTTGFAYEWAPHFSGYLLTMVRTDADNFLVPGRLIDPDTIKKMAELASALKEIAEIEVIGYELREKVPSEIRVRAADGFDIWLLREDDFSRAAGILKKTLELEIKERRKNLEYLDLRLGNKVFYKFREAGI